MRALNIGVYARSHPCRRHLRVDHRQALPRVGGPPRLLHVGAALLGRAAVKGRGIGGFGMVKGRGVRGARMRVLAAAGFDVGSRPSPCSLDASFASVYAGASAGQSAASEAASAST
eukprot:scaffold55276_cov36-Phaeocystis_antarctica.AAC.1